MLSLIAMNAKGKVIDDGLWTSRSVGRAEILA